MTQWVGCAVMLVGAVLSLLAALGVLRMPDSFMRIHAATKSGVLGAGLVLIGAALSLGGGAAMLKALTAVALLAFAAPVAAQVLARAAYQKRQLEVVADTRRATNGVDSHKEPA